MKVVIIFVAIVLLIDAVQRFFIEDRLEKLEVQTAENLQNIHHIKTNTKLQPILVGYLLDTDATVPCKAHKEDAGFDLYTPVGFTLEPHEQKTLDIGVKLQIPNGFYGQISSKSGIATKKQVTSRAGVIDSNYRGSIGVVLRNEGDEEVSFQRGDKIAQLLILPVPDVLMYGTDGLSDTDRGEGGFGSTGR